VVRFDAVVYEKFRMVETVGFHQVLWLVMLVSAKDQIFRLDTPGQHVTPHVRYGTTCLLIRDAVGSVPCLDEWGVAWSFVQAYMMQEGSWYHVLLQETLALLWHCILT
jgi:hypothetical protein